jgi:hypothetical protein
MEAFCPFGNGKYPEYMELFVSQEIRRKSGKVVETSIRITLSTRPFKFKNHHGTTPVLGRGAGGDVVDGTVDWAAA